MSKRPAKRICPDHNCKLLGCSTRYGMRYACPQEGCTVVCWGNKTSTPANQETRDLRHECHALYDPLWKDEQGPFSKGKRKNSNNVRRGRAMRWMADKMEIQMEDMHFGMFNADQCRQALEFLEELVAEGTVS